MVSLAQHDRGFDLVYSEVPAGPDYITIAAALKARLSRGTALVLARTTRRIDFLKELNAVAFLPEPVDAFGRDISIHNDAVTGFLDSHNDGPELIAKLR